MAKGPTYSVKFRRRRENKTNYKKRMNLLKSKLLRLVIRKSNYQIICQLIKFSSKGDMTLLSVTSNQLKKFGWKHSLNNTPAAYLTGALLGQFAKEKKLSEVILDSGFYTLTKGSKIYAVLNGAVDAGLNVKHSPTILLDESRINGEHLNKKLRTEFEEIKKKIFAK